MLEHDGPRLSSDIQRAIGQRLRQHYAIERSLPARLMKIALTTALAAAVLMPVCTENLDSDVLVMKSAN
jgi:hypothetical protein